MKKFSIPWIPIAGLAIFILLYLSNIDFILDENLQAGCSERPHTTCNSSENISDTTPPDIEQISPEMNEYEIDPSTNGVFIVCDNNSGVNIGSLQASIDLPSIGSYEYFPSDTESLISRDLGNGCYEVEVSLNDDIPDGNSIVWGISICDCADNMAKSYIRAINATWIRYNFWEMGYILQFVIWWFAIFGPQLLDRSWGVVYDSSTKKPISRAIIRLYSINNTLVESVVSDVNGVFILKPQAGTYVIKASATHYIFPSKLKPLKTDGRRKNLYYGEKITVTENSRPVRICIPLDQKERIQKPTLAQKIHSRSIGTLTAMNTWMLLFTGVILPILWLKPPWILHTLTFSGMNFLLLIIQFLLKRKARGRLGTVLDENQKVVPEIELGLYDASYDRLVEIIKTDRKGKYQFVVPGGKYYIKPMGNTFILTGHENQKGIPVGKETNENILIAPDIQVRKTSVGS